mgnify:CR=1 FL=1
MERGLRARGAPPRLSHAIYKNLQANNARAILHGIASDDTVPKQKGAMEGGAASPLLFNSALFPIMVPLEQKWREEGSGLRWRATEGPDVDISLLLFCDNFYIISHSIGAALQSAHELENALGQSGFSIKEGSLQMLAIFFGKAGLRRRGG